MSRADDPSSDLRTNSIIAASEDDLSTTMVINARSGAASPGIPFWIGYTTYLYQTAALDAESDSIIP